MEFQLSFLFSLLLHLFCRIITQVSKTCLILMGPSLHVVFSLNFFSCRLSRNYKANFVFLCHMGKKNMRCISEFFLNRNHLLIKEGNLKER